MKIDVKEDKTIVYLYNYELSFEDISKLTKEIKSIFIKLIKTYHLKLNGYLKVEVYCNKYYGYILVIEKIYSDDDFVTIDLKLEINDNCDFYFKTSDYFTLKDYQNIYFNLKDNSFYINIKNIENILQIIEFGQIVYDFNPKYSQLLNND